VNWLEMLTLPVWLAILVLGGLVMFRINPTVFAKLRAWLIMAGLLLVCSVILWIVHSMIQEAHYGGGYGNLILIRDAVLLYANNHEGFVLETLRDVVQHTPIQSQEFIRAGGRDSDKKRRALSESDEGLEALADYKIIGGYDLRRLENPARTVLAHERVQDDGRAQFLVVFADGHGEALNRDQLDAALEYTQEAVARAREARKARRREKGA